MMSGRLRELLRRLRGASPPPPRVRPPAPSPAAPAPVRVADIPDPVRFVLGYHDRTKHQPGRYARSLGTLDWESQPDPFRWYDGAPKLPLDLVAPAAEGPRFEEPFVEGTLPAAPLDRAFISRLFQDALGLSAWKQAGDARWALRVNPSSGNLHPTEGWLVTGPVPGLTATGGVFHYHPYLHSLELRGTLAEGAWPRLNLPEGAVLVGLTSIVWRESWKYGERAYRYCQHDVGHALAAVALSAAALGWRCRLLHSPTDGDIAVLLGVDDQSGIEAEEPDALLLLTPNEPPAATWRDWRPPAGLPLERPPATPRRLSAEHHDWPILEEVSVAARCREPAAASLFEPVLRPNAGLQVGDAPFSFRTIVHQRRSAVSMDGRSGLTRAAFEQVLWKLVPGSGFAPHAALPWAPRVHLLLWVHRVQGIEPGRYLLLRDPAREDELRKALSPHFVWETPAGCPEGLPLVCLSRGDSRREAAGASCGQDIASDGCFAVAMLAELGPTLRAGGPSFYRRLHWEAGLVGQMLYLESEASGLRGTGIGCFFDDVTHNALGLRDPDWQVLYHFTVGGPVDDERLQSLPAYAHLDDLALRSPSRGG